MKLEDKRFYVGSEAIKPGAAFLKTIEEAIDDAQRYFANNPTATTRYIVKVVKVVRRNPPPVIIEDVE